MAGPIIFDCLRPPWLIELFCWLFSACLAFDLFLSEGWRRMKSVPKQHSIQKEWRSVVKGHDDGFVVDCWLRWLCHLENERLLSSARDLYLPYNKPRLARFNAIRPTFSAFTFIYRITMETENKDMSDLHWFFSQLSWRHKAPKKGPNCVNGR